MARGGGPVTTVWDQGGVTTRPAVEGYRRDDVWIVLAFPMGSCGRSDVEYVTAHYDLSCCVMKTGIIPNDVR